MFSEHGFKRNIRLTGEEGIFHPGYMITNICQPAPSKDQTVRVFHIASFTLMLTTNNILFQFNYCHTLTAEIRLLGKTIGPG